MNRLLVSLSCLTVLGLLVGCTPAAAPAPTAKAPAAEAPKAPAPTPSPQPPAPTARQPRYGGVLTTSMYADIPSLDVHQENTFLMNAVQSAYNNVVQYDPNDPQKIIGDLAEKWDVSADGLTYTFLLRKGVKFHDGRELTAEDVRYSLDRLYNPGPGIRSPMRDNLRAISALEASSSETLKVTLKFQHAAFLDGLANGQIVVYPKHVVEAKGHMKNDVVGTGPFKFKDYASGVAFEVVKNQDYFVPGRPYLDGIKNYIVKDDAARLATFRTGQIKFMGPLISNSGIKPSQARVIEKEMPSAKIYRFNPLASRWFEMVTNKPPFNDVRLRRAMSLALDRQTAIKVLVEGEGQIGAHFTPSQWAIPKEELEKRPGYRQPKDADIAEAKRLMAEAGFANGLKTRILARAGNTEDVAVFSKEQLAKIGVDLEIIVRESSVFLALLTQHVFESVAQPIGLRTDDPDHMSRYFHSQGAMRFMALEDKAVDDLYAKQASILDVAERKKVLRELEERLFELAPSAVLFWTFGIMASWPEVEDFRPGISVYNNNKYAHVWLAK
ncbi:MAG: ABC transporter substrate-binding protein [Chloroflexi bacterium]|nr:ABC transporter substrate-binding protein [Chloroflexota bacterium]